MADKNPPNMRFQTAFDKTKALRQYEQLKRSGMVTKAVVITELKDGSYHVLGQNLMPREVAPLLVVAADALAHADADRTLIKLTSHVEPERRGEHNQQRPRLKEITTAPDGAMVPPKGENFISCGECSHPTWFVLHYDDIEPATQSRMACAHCGNEVKNIPMAPPGHA